MNMGDVSSSGKIHGCILTPRGFVDGTLDHVGGRVQRIEDRARLHGVSTDVLMR